MTSLLKQKAAAWISACGMAFATASAHAQMTYTAGDLILGFQASGGDGSANTYVFNLGSGTAFRNLTTTGVIANLATDLNNTFGIGWYARTDLYWGIAGVRDAAGGGANTVVAGDPRATIYISRAAATPGSSTPWNLPTDSGDPNRSSSTISAAGAIVSAQGGYLTITGETVVTTENRRTPTPSSGGRGTVQGTGDTNSWNQFNPIGGAAFGNVLTGGVQAPLGTGQAQAHLDVYRLMGRFSASANPSVPAGQGLRIGTFSINANGDVSFAGPVTSSPYDTWADSFSLAGADRAKDADLDGDGLENAVEFVVGGHPRQGTDGDKQPTVIVGAGFFDFVFRRVDAASPLNPRAEHDTDLVGPWTPAVDGTGGVTVTVDNDALGAGVDRVTVRIPSSGPLHFARLVVPAN